MDTFVIYYRFIDEPTQHWQRLPIDFRTEREALDMKYVLAKSNYDIRVQESKAEPPL